VGALIRNTLDGLEPTSASALFTAPILVDGTVTVDKNLTLKAKAFKSGLAPSNTTAAAYTIQAHAPQMSPVGGTYATAQAVTITSATSGATIRYTTDGSEPTGARPRTIPRRSERGDVLDAQGEGVQDRSRE